MLQDFFEVDLRFETEEMSIGDKTRYRHQVCFEFRPAYQNFLVDQTYSLPWCKEKEVDLRCSFTASNIAECYLGIISQDLGHSFSVLTNTSEVVVPKHANQPQVDLSAGTVVIVNNREGNNLVVSADDVRWRDLLRLVSINVDVITDKGIDRIMSYDPLLGVENG